MIETGKIRTLLMFVAVAVLFGFPLIITSVYMALYNGTIWWGTYPDGFYNGYAAIGSFFEILWLIFLTCVFGDRIFKPEGIKKQ